jgi:hypothetical protein
MSASNGPYLKEHLRDDGVWSVYVHRKDALPSVYVLARVESERLADILIAALTSGASPEQILALHNLEIPDAKVRLEAVAEKLQELSNSPKWSAQLEIDDLVYDNLGCGKWASNINNQSVLTQAEALAERLGLEETCRLLEEILANHQRRRDDAQRTGGNAKGSQ